MPARLIEDENGVCPGGDLGGDLVEMKLHGFAVARRQHESGAGAAIGTDRTEQVGRPGPLIMGGAGARIRIESGVDHATLATVLAAAPGDK
jgi:hypothetical protein